MIKDKTILLACFCAVIGAIVYALLVFGVMLPQPYPYYGTDIYNAYFYRLLEGRFDLPMRMLTLEGHYSADGTGILYHGIAPLLTRAVLHPFVPLNQFPTAAFSVWIWATIGTGFYHLAIFQVVRKYVGQISLFWAAILGLTIWICSPGFLLSTNPVLYHEPISISYAAMAVGFYLMLRCALFGMAWRYALIPAAFMAGILLHARPHLAVGLYVGILVMIALSLWHDRKRTLVPAFISLAVLGLVGISFLQLNTARFGSATAAHGQIEGPDTSSQVQYSLVFFGSDYATAGQGRAIAEHGRFHPWRIVPNALIYTFDTPIASTQIAKLHRNATESITGQGYIESPRFGMLFLWTPWIVLLVVGLIIGRPRISGGLQALPILVATGIGAGLMLSYPTVTLRYRIDVWPFVMALCLLCFPGVIRRFGLELLQNTRVVFLSFIVVLSGVFSSVRAAIPLTLSYQKAPGRTYEPWDAEMCLARLTSKDFSPERMQELCVDPEIVFTQRDQE